MFRVYTTLRYLTNDKGEKTVITERLYEAVEINGLKSETHTLRVEDRESKKHHTFFPGQMIDVPVPKKKKKKKKASDGN